MGSEMRIEIPSQLIEDTIRVEMIRAISKNGESEKWIQAIVKEAMDRKKDSYSSKTYFQDAVSKMIIEEAQSIFSEWLSENKDAIGKALKKYLTENKHAALTQICETLATNIQTYGVGIRANLVDIDK